MAPHAPLSVKLRPHRAGQELLELQVGGAAGLTRLIDKTDPPPAS